jgi:hypothetical protein
MTHDHLQKSTNCNCLEKNCFEDVISLWGIKTNKNHLRENDFITHFERGEKHIDIECEEICSLLGKSMCIINDGSLDHKDEVLTIYKALFPLAPGYKPFLSVIRFKKDSGLIKYTPLQTNKFHHDFYRSDTFTYSEVELIETISLASV